MMHQVYLGASLSPSPREGHVLMISDKKFVAQNDSPVTFTVWKKSLVFNGSGYIVFDSSGNLDFRVDNYAYNARDQLFLMDTAGNVLLTLLHKAKRKLVKPEIMSGEDVLSLVVQPGIDQAVRSPHRIQSDFRQVTVTRDKLGE